MRDPGPGRSRPAAAAAATGSSRATKPFPVYWSGLWVLLRCPAAARGGRPLPAGAGGAAGGWRNLDQAMVAACVLVCADTILGVVDELTRAGRLATLGRWAQRYPALVDLARPAWSAAARDAATACPRRNRPERRLIAPGSRRLSRRDRVGE